MLSVAPTLDEYPSLYSTFSAPTVASSETATVEFLISATVEAVDVAGSNATVEAGLSLPSSSHVRNSRRLVE